MAEPIREGGPSNVCNNPSFSRNELKKREGKCKVCGGTIGANRLAGGCVCGAPEGANAHLKEMEVDES